MLLPEINNISPYEYRLSGFGGINRRENAGVDELSDAVNISSDEYPLVTTRKKYDKGLFYKTVLMWHNNDRDMALVPYLAPEDLIIISSQAELNEYVKSSESYGSHKILYTGESFGMLQYFETDPGDMITAVPLSIALVPGKAYTLSKSSWLIARNCMLGKVSAVVGKSLIVYKDHKIEIRDVVAFKNPVCANIGTSTVICDELNGMWVLEYNKELDTYSYNKVQNKYTVSNEETGNFITGGNYCHVRCRFEDNTLIKDIVWAENEETLNSIKSRSDSVNKLVAYGATPHIECSWYRVTSGGGLLPVDFLHYEFCTLEGSMMFNVGDYVEVNMSGIWKRDPNLAEELAGLNGLYDVVKIGENDDGVKYSLFLKSAVKTFATMSALLITLGVEQKEGESKTNNIFLANGATIERKAPKNIKFICSHMNRIWANNGDNEILCCARGNPYVWYRYEGNSLDSWATTVGGDGSFTGCVNYGYPLFFKDNRMYRITGTRPANYGFDEYSIKGIKKGCHDSAAIVNDVLYYQSIDGIYAYNASTPVCVSEKVWKNWQNGKACRFRDKYYIAVTENGENKLYCYDTRYGTWHREDLCGSEVRFLYPGRYLEGYEEYLTVYTDYTDAAGADVSAMVGNTGAITSTSSFPSFDEEAKKKAYYLGFVMSTGDDSIYTKEKNVKWYFITTDLLALEREKKYIRNVYINMKDVDGNRDIWVFADYSGCGEWQPIPCEKSHAQGKRATWRCYSIPQLRLENLKLKVEGRGAMVIYNIVLEFEKGSDTV